MNLLVVLRARTKVLKHDKILTIMSATRERRVKVDVSLFCRTPGGN